jgi:hypothetical protein
MKGSVFCDITPCSGRQMFNHRFGGTYRLQLQGLKVSHARKQPEVGSKKSKEGLRAATSSSEKSVDFHRTAWLYVPGDGTVLSFRCFLEVSNNFRRTDPKTKLCRRSPQANYIEGATTACRRSCCQTLRVEECCLVSARNSHGR